MADNKRMNLSATAAHPRINKPYWSHAVVLVVIRLDVNQNPYASANSNKKPYVAWIPTIACGITTLVAIPICFFGKIELETMAGTEINNPAVIAYLLIVAVLALPCALITAFLLGPLFHRFTRSKIKKLNGFIGIVLLVIVWIMFDLYFPTVMNSNFPKFDGWLMYYNLVSFLGLPIIAGTCTYLTFAPIGLAHTEIGG